MIYYSCRDVVLIIPIVTRMRGELQSRMQKRRCFSVSLVCGPRGIRTLGLLNAIEARSQLRYGPLWLVVYPVPWRVKVTGALSGPGGI